MICAIIQARCESVRFPFKVLSKINGKTLIEILVDRLKKSKYLDRIIIATSNDKSNKKKIDYKSSGDSNWI